MYPSIAAAALRVKAEQAIIDGEIVALDASGRPSFQALQHRGSHPSNNLVFYAFDLLHLDGADLTQQPLSERRAPLARILDGGCSSRTRCPALPQRSWPPSGP
jgi:bifunctional non-homologous end joining protein LigD